MKFQTTDDVTPRFRIIFGEVRRLSGFKIAPDLAFLNRLIKNLATSDTKGCLPGIIKNTGIEALQLAQPAAAYAIYTMDEEVLGWFPDADYLALAAVTIGSKVESKASEYMQSRQLTLGILLDAWGSALVEGAVRAINAVIAKEADILCCSAGKRRSPGYGQWKLSEQKSIHTRLSASGLGIELSEASVMIPVKSVTFGVPLKRISSP